MFRPTYDAEMRTLPLVASVACLALVAGCTSGPASQETSSPAPIESASQDAGETAASEVNAADVQPWAAGAVPGGQASGPAYPETWPSARIEGSGSSTSLTPTLVAPKVSGRVDVEVVSLTQGGGFGADAQGEATGIVFDEPAAADAIEIPAGTLTEGSTYAWRVTKDGETWEGPWLFNVDTSRSATAPTDDVNGVLVNLLSGVATVGWMSRVSPSGTGPLQVGAIQRPDLPETPGLPAGWSWVLPGSGALLLVESEAMGGEGDTAGPLSVTLLSSTGAGTTYVRTDTGAYVPGLADGTATQYAQGGVLTQVEQGVWQFMSPGGTVTRYQAGRPVAEWTNGVPTATFTWDDKDRLVSIGDGVSRSLSIAYAGSGDCPAASWGNGFSTSDGMWCSLTLPDGSVSAVGYVGKQIGLIAEPGGISAGFGWDASGRLSAVRSSDSGAAAATAGWTAADITTTVEYDNRGRVASVTTPAARPGDARVTRTYEYPVEADGGQLRAAVSQSTGSGQGQRILSVTATQDSWQVLTRTDATGRTSKAEYQEGTGALTQGTDPTGRTTTVDLNKESLVTSSIGPYLGSTESALRSDRVVDATASAPTADGFSSAKRWEGLAAAVWTKDGVTPQWWDRSILRSGSDRPGLAANLNFNGPWTAQATGTWTIEESGRYTIEAAGSDGLTVIPTINGVQCRDGNGASQCVIDLKKGRQSLSLVITGNGPGSFDVRAGTDGPRAIDAASLSPNYGSTTAVKVNDSVRGQDLSVQVLDITRPWTGQPDTVTTNGGLTTTYAYEKTDPASGQWGRMTGMTTPGGSVQSLSYYGDSESVSDPCTGSSYPQAGLPKTQTRYDGVQITTIYNAAGQAVSVTTTGEGASEQACSAFDAAGRMVSTTLTDKSGATLGSTRATYTWKDGQQVSTTVDTVEGTDYTTVVVRDILGRTVSYTDAWGNRTDYTYDATGNVLQKATRPSGQDKAAITVDYAYDDYGSMIKVTVNGTEAASVVYADDQLVRSVSYAGGVTRNVEYDTAGAARSVILDTKGRVFDQAVTRNSAGRVLNTSVRVTGKGEKLTAAEWTYGYDSAGRLVEATLTTSGDATASGGEKRRFTYNYGSSEACPSQAGADLDRTGGSRDGVDFTTCYDQRGRLAWSSDPAVAPEGGKANATWDGLGRLTALDATTPLALSWAGGTQVASVTQGESTATFLTAAGQPIQQSIDDSVTRLGYDGAATGAPVLLTDGAGAITQMRVDLPSGAQAILSPDGALTEIHHVDAQGAMLTTTAVDGTARGRGEAALADRYGPFGEPLTPEDAFSPPATYGWQADARNASLGGAHDLTISARPYHPWLGQFLAFDPAPGAATSGYSYGAADPINRPDVSGNWDTWDWVTAVGGVLAFVGGLSAGTVAGSTSRLAVGVNKALRYGGAAIAGVGIIGNVSQGGWDTDATISTVVAVVGGLAVAYGSKYWQDNFMKKRHPMYESVYKAEFDARNAQSIAYVDRYKTQMNAFIKAGSNWDEVDISKRAALQRAVDLQQQLSVNRWMGYGDGILKAAQRNNDREYLKIVDEWTARLARRQG